MGTRTGITILAASVLVLSSASSAQFQEPSHPLSQITPVDVPLNMSNKAVLNVSVLSLSNPSGGGFNIDNYAITDTTGTNRLELNPSQNQFQIQGSEFDLAGNNLTTPNNIKTGGQPITLRDSTNQQDLLQAKEGGTVEVPNSNELVFSDPDGRKGQIYQDGSNLVIRNADNNVGVDIISKGKGTTIRGRGGDDNALVVEEDTGGRIALFEGGNSGEVTLTDSNLNVTGNNITNIDTLKFEEGTSIDGNLTINGSTDITGELNLSGDINLSDNNLLDANKVEANRIIDPEDEQINIDDNINLQNNQNIRSSGTNAITLDNNQNIGIPNGNLSITGNAPNSNLNLGGDIDTEVARIDTGGNNYFISLKSGKGFEVADSRGNIKFATGDDTTEIGRTYTFDIGSNEFTLNQDDTDILTANTGSASHAVRDTANSADLVTLQEGGPVAIRNPIADEDVVRVNASGGSNVEIPNGDLDVGNPGVSGASLDVGGGIRMNSGNDLDFGGVNWRIRDATSSNELVFQERQGSNTKVLKLRNEGNVEIPNGKLDINGNRVVDGGGNGDDTVFIGDGNNDNVRLETGGEDVDVPDGQVDVNSPTNTGRAVDVGGGVNADGDLKTFSGNVTSDQRMCIGDRCA